MNGPNALVDCIRQKLGRIPGLHSLILYGSLVRGDFVPKTSDVDFFAVLEDATDPEEVISKIRPVLEECSKHLNPVEVDIAWEWLPNLQDPLHLGYPYKFLTVYLKDFNENHITILGEDVLKFLPEHPLQPLILERLERTTERLDSLNPKMLHITAGEMARLLAFLNGSDLRKENVLKKLIELGDEDAGKIYRGYMKGRKTEFSKEFLTEFIISRAEKIRKKCLPLLSSVPKPNNHVDGQQKAHRSQD